MLLTSYGARDNPPMTENYPIQNVHRWVRRETFPGRLLRRIFFQKKMTQKKAGSAPFKIKYLPPLSHIGKQVTFYFSLWGGFSACWLAFLADASWTAQRGLLCIRQRSPRMGQRHKRGKADHPQSPQKLAHTQLGPPQGK